MAFDISDRSLLASKTKSCDLASDDLALIEHNLINLMQRYKGIGLAANQVGMDFRAFSIGSASMDHFRTPIVVFNPRIISNSEAVTAYKEGCLSFPDLWLQIKRPASIVVEFWDSKGRQHTTELHDLDARCFQHEYDHLDGVCFVDKVSKLKLNLAMKSKRKKQK